MIERDVRYSVGLQVNNQVILYQPNDDIRVSVRLDKDTVWLTQEQMCQLFGRDRSVISKHIRNAFKEGELDESVSCANFAHDTPHGAMKGRTKTSYTMLYNLDVIISVGYRVKSIQGTRFRQWALRVLKEMLLNRFSDIRRLDRVASKVADHDRAIGDLKRGMKYLVEKIAAPEPPVRKRIAGFSEGK